MIDLSKIKNRHHGDGSGDCSGSGDGHGDGSGRGDGYGYGYGSGDCSGSGDGDGYGSSHGFGDGSGYGSGAGDGAGYGDGYGYGYSFGSGDGSGYGSGDGSSSSDRFVIPRHTKVRRIKTIKRRNKMNIDELTLGQIKEIKSMFGVSEKQTSKHPMFGRRCLVRTYSAGVHIGDVTWINPENAMECKLENALRLWKWEDGGLSLSAVANNGINGGRLNETGEVMLTNAIEYIPTTKKAEVTYAKFIEDKK